MPVEPNSVHRSDSSRTLILVSIGIYAFMVFGGVVLIAAGVGRGVNAARIALGPVVMANAEVIDKDVENGVLKIYYAFQPPGAPATYVGIEPVTSEQYAGLDEGSTVSVEYLSGDPNTNWVPGQSPFGGEVIAALAGLVLGIFVLGVTQWRFRPRGVREAWRNGRFP